MWLQSLILSFLALSRAQSEECALVIPKRSGQGSFFPNSVFGSQQEVCISFDAVNKAFVEASRLVGEALPDGRHEADSEEASNLATVLQETTRILAHNYELSADTVANGLKLIDLSQTLVYRHCPARVSYQQCELERYRSLSGVCNNLENSYWGAAGVAHSRFLPADYADGISAPRAALSGRPLPSARLVSAQAHHDEGHHDHAITLLLVAWGQFIDHDITLTGEARDKRSGKAPRCCQDEAEHPNCFPIEIPARDDFYGQHRQRCMNFARSLAGLKGGCKLGPRCSLNELSSLLDAGTIYSNEEDVMRTLRSFQGGLLKMLPVFEEFNLKELLPLNLEKPDEGCIRPSRDVYCFFAGDARVNEQTVLALIHTLMVREHNRVATELGRINPHWNDETLFQETRHIMAAVVQHITYNEFLPMVLGKDVMAKEGLLLLEDGYSDDYDPKVDPSATSGFITAAFRFGHTLLPSTIERWSKNHRYVGSQRLSEMLQQPYDLFKGGWADTYLMGLVNQVAQAYDDSVTEEVTNHLFKEPGKKFGLDLAALNVQRGRDHGVPSYNNWREWCGQRRIRHWDEMRAYMKNDTVNAYASMYESPDDIDLWTAGISEKSLPGSLLGPTFACIVGRQFSNLKRGDRFWYENGGYPSSFTLEQLNALRQVRFSRILCDNADDLDSIQIYGMVLPDHEINPRVPCRSNVIPRLDLSLWRDASHFPHPF